MGNWITSTFLRSFDLFQRHHLHPNHHYLNYHPNPHHQRFLELSRAAAAAGTNHTLSLRTAAEIVANQRMKTNRTNDSDTDFSDDDEESSGGCPKMTPQEEQRMFEREQQIAFSGRCTIGDPESCTQLRKDINHRCGPRPSTSANTAWMILNRDVQNLKNSGAMATSSRAQILNSHLPNRKRRVDALRTKNFCAQYVQNGRKMVVSSQDEKIRFYQRNPEKSKYRSRYYQCNELRVDHCNWSILDTAVSQNGQLICYCTWKDAVYIGKMEQEDQQNVTWFPIDWNGDSGQNQCAVFCVRFSEDSEQIVCGTSEYSIHVFDVEQRRRIRTIVNAHEDDVNSVCFADLGSNLIYSAGDDGLVKVWDKRAWSDGDVIPVGVFAGHRDGVTYVDSRQDERYLLSNSKDQTIKVWDLRKFSNQQGVEATRACVQSQHWDYRWQPAPPGLCQAVQGDTSVMTLRGHSVLHTLVRAKFSPENTGRRYIYTGCARGEVVVYDIVSGNVSRRLKGHQAVVRECDWHPQENEIVSSSWDGVTMVWTWDERAEGVIAPFDHPNISGFGDEDSCDEFYQPIIRKQQKKQRKTVTMRNAKCPTTSQDPDDF